MPDPILRPHADRTLDLAWGRFAYADRGGGQPILLLHGSGRDHRDWEALLHHLPGRRLLRPDLRGHGGSSLPPKAFDLPELVDDLARLADALWLGKLDLVGHSLGGRLALRFLEAHPDRVNRVAVLDGWVAAHHAQALGEDRLDGTDPARADAIRRAYTSTYVRWPAGVREATWNAFDRYDAGPMLARTNHRVLFVYGDRGRGSVPRARLGIPQRPNLDVLWMERAGHYFLLEAPDLTGDTLRRFLIGSDTPPESPPPPDLSELTFRPPGV